MRVRAWGHDGDLPPFAPWERDVPALYGQPDLAAMSEAARDLRTVLLAGMAIDYRHRPERQREYHAASNELLRLGLYSRLTARG